MPDFLTEYFSGLAEGLLSTLKTPDAYLNKVALTAAILVLSLGLYVLFKKMIVRNVKEYTKKLQLKKATKQIMVTLMIIMVLFIWVQAINVLILLALLFGVFGVFMVRGLTDNLIGYFVIKYRQYFEVGHRVEIAGIIGDIIDIGPVNITLLEVRHGLSSDAKTGRIIKLPNTIIFNESVEIVGVSNSFVWHEIKYVLSFESDWQAAEKIMMDAGNNYFEETVAHELDMTNDYLSGEPKNVKPVFSVDVNADGIVLVLCYLVDYRNGTKVKTELQRILLPQLSAHPAISFAIAEVKVFRG